MAFNREDFVDRDPEVRSFGRVLAHPTQRIFLLRGGEGMGKTDLLQRLRHECKGTAVKTVLLDFRYDDELTEPRQVIDRLRERIGGCFDEVLTRAVEKYSAPSRQPSLLEAMGIATEGSSSLR